MRTSDQLVHEPPYDGQESLACHYTIITYNKLLTVASTNHSVASCLVYSSPALRHGAKPGPTVTAISDISYINNTLLLS